MFKPTVSLVIKFLCFTEETTEKIDEIAEEADNAGFGFKISAIASMNAASENLEEMEISEGNSF